MRIEDNFNFKDPDYAAVFRARAERIEKFRKDPSMLPALKVYYRDHIGQFISDFGVTFDPRNIERGLPTTIPFILFPKQLEWTEWIIDNWRNQRPGLTEKTRQMGFSWLTMALSCSLCLFYDGMTIGVGSRKQEYVDVLGDPKSLMQKARLFMASLPAEFRGSWRLSEHAPHMRIMFPNNGSVITGESGDNIGRGNSTSIYFVDEAAFLEHSQLVDNALSQTTNCRQDISTPNGMANSFAQKRHGGKIKVFSFHWRSDPRKDDEWYAKQLSELDAVTIAQEIDVSYSASVEGVVIPSAWVQAAIGAHLKLGIMPTGSKFAALDVADEGIDNNALAGRHGFLLNYIKSWSGKGSDIYKTVVNVFAICEELGHERFDYDADGLGSGVRGDANNINEARRAAGKRPIRDEPFRGSAAVFDPEGEMVPKRKNKDYFLNCKSMSWWALRLRFQATHRAVVEHMPYEPDSIISIDPSLEELTALTMELSQPTFSINNVGKIVIDKAPDGTRSPNIADAVMIVFNPGHRVLDLWARLAA